MGLTGTSKPPTTAQVSEVNKSLSGLSFLSSGSSGSSLSDLTYRGGSGSASASDFLDADTFHINHDISFPSMGSDALRSYDDYMPSTGSDYAAGGKLTFTEAPKSEPTTWIDFTHDDDLALSSGSAMLDSLTLQPDGTAPLSQTGLSQTDLAVKQAQADAQWLADMKEQADAQWLAGKKSEADALWQAQNPTAALTVAPTGAGQFPTTFVPPNQTVIDPASPVTSTPYYLPDLIPHRYTRPTDSIGYDGRLLPEPVDHPPGQYDPVTGLNLNPTAPPTDQMLLDGTLLSNIEQTPTGGLTTPPAVAGPGAVPGGDPNALLTFTPGPTSTLYNPAVVPPGFPVDPAPSTLGFAQVHLQPWNPGLSSTTSPAVTTPTSSTPVDVGPYLPGALPTGPGASTRPGATDVPGNLVAGPSAGARDGLGDHSTGDDVRAVQLALGVPATGIWDPATRAAVKAWQGQHLFSPSGQVSAAEWALITAPQAAVAGAGSMLLPPAEARPLAIDGYPNLQAVTQATPQELAFLRAMRPGEGTNNDHSYSTVVGGGINPDPENHPGDLDPEYFRTTGANSDATGAYQWLSTTWNDRAAIANERYKGRYQIRTTDQGHLALDPTSQDVAALEFIRDLGVSKALAAGDLDAAIDAAAGTWASLRGGGQEHAEHVDAFERRYQEALQDEQNRALLRNGRQ